MTEEKKVEEVHEHADLTAVAVPNTTLYCPDCDRLAEALVRMDDCYEYYACPCGRRECFERWGPSFARRINRGVHP